MAEKRTQNLLELKRYEVGHYVKIEDKYYRITDIEPFVAVKSYGNIPARQKTGELRESALEPKEGFFRWVAMPLSRIRIRFKIPGAVDRYILEGISDSGYLGLDELDGVEPAFAFTVFPQDRVTFVLENPNTTDVEAIIKFYGFKYKIEEVTESDVLEYVRRLEKEGKLPIYKIRR